MKHTTSFTPGDSVVVTSGPFNGLTGVVQSVAKDFINIAPSAEQDLKEVTKVEREHVEKFFRRGDCVKVLAGKNAGETGMVVKVDPKHQIVTLVSDLSQKSVTLDILSYLSSFLFILLLSRSMCLLHT